MDSTAIFLDNDVISSLYTFPSRSVAASLIFLGYLYGIISVKDGNFFKVTFVV